MYDDDDFGTARPFGRSYYALLVTFPIACFVLTLLTDVAYVATDSVLWETASVWLLTIALFVAAAAVVAGIVDLVRSRRVRIPARAWLRVVGEFAAFGVAFVNVFVHSRDGYTAVVPEGLILSLLTVIVLAATLFVARPGARLATKGYAR